MKELGVSPRAISLALVTDINGLFKPAGIQIFPYTKRCVRDERHLLTLKEPQNQPTKSLSDHLKSSLSLVLGVQVLGVNYWPARVEMGVEAQLLSVRLVFGYASTHSGLGIAMRNAMRSLAGLRPKRCR